MNINIKKMIKKYATKRSFTYKSITQNQIDDAEKVLSVKLPTQYLEFLEEFGQGGIGGIEILGVGADNSLVFVEETIDCRKYGLPKNFVTVENCGEWFYCINSDDGSVVSWSEDFTKDEYDDFDAFLLDRFKDAAENL